MEAPACQALRRNWVNVSQAIERHLSVFIDYLTQEAFISRRQASNIMELSGVSVSVKAAQARDGIAAKVESDQNTENDRKWLQKFLQILGKPDINEVDLARNIVAIYNG